ncbi:tetratricopeptide (TPR) repeat protein [Lewinella marina]|uniref:Tetratricopeptide repeat protein n=1 Tax=Neolewinella marina TaxID=438751 RepID=A0A2G0CC87_9BACT|nr:hypothetical protein [Neolewinella marina]NJB86730.1 tetratricopeptide (TPR) repeat protein [Neolewinella marina]PHK97537.1 hypothetical protein CGL56_15680 [Neolewinella marina]
MVTLILRPIGLALLLVCLCTCGDRPQSPLAHTGAQAATAACLPATNDRAWYETKQKAPLFDSMGQHHFPITTRRKLVQRYFDQGLVLAYGFNHAEAARSFYHATRLDPDSPMPYWGYAYVLGPNYNAGMEKDNYPRAYEAVQRAKNLARMRGTEKEKALINALATRYHRDAPEARSALDQAYAEAMRKVATRFPDDADVLALFAEALMDLHPWDLWDKAGEPRTWTPEILETLDQVLAIAPDHPGANHFYIHAIEGSRTPDKGLASARTLDAGLVPGAGHLMHMPSHIYIRTGDYHAGSLANRAAVRVDSSYITACRAQGAYPLIYHPHNYHFLAATATLEGKPDWAMDAALRTARHADNDLMTVPELGMLQHYYTIPDYVRVKFGLWDEILNSIDVRRDLTYPKIIRHYARGMAYLGKDDPAAAAVELAALRKLAAGASIDSLVIGVNTARAVASIAEGVLAGELAASEGDYDSSIELLEKAVAVEDALHYMEPPDWFFSVRHHLGAVLLEAGRFADAARVYEEDLLTFPRNGWALRGLQTAYEGMGETAKARGAAEQLEKAWATADIALTASRIM